MALLHFKLEGNYPDTGNLPDPKIIKHSLQYLSNENSTTENIHSLALDILRNLKQKYAHFAWVIDITDVCSFYGSDKQDCVRNLKLRQQHYATGIYYCFAIVLLNGQFFALEFKCVSDEIFSDSDSPFIEIDI